MAFPPIPVYPKALDNDYTLYLVYNTTETKLAADNSPWAQEIDIMPVQSNATEVWANNGFGNIDGELFYYDSVKKDVNGKVNKLLGCARQMGGEKTKFNKRGTWVRSFVIAEHHNQLVNAIMKTQKFIGYNFTPDQTTLDWRIRNLQALEIIFDDYACPDVNFTFNIIQNDPVAGVVAEYVIQITPPGSISSFRLDFGDGEFTTANLSGQHQYAINATIDPVVSVSNDKCQIIQTPITRDNPTEPAPNAIEQFDIPIPEIPDVPDFTFVPCDVPEPDLNIPAIVTPCVSIQGQIGPIPSVITGPTITMVSNVVITGPDFPVNVTQSVISILGGNIPSMIIIDPPIPPTIIIDPPIPPTIIIVPPNSNITLGLNFEDIPRLEVDWGQIPQMEVALTMAQQVKNPQKFAADPDLRNEFGEEFADLFEANNTMKLEYESVGIPSEIMIIPPSKDSLTINTGDLFTKQIRLDSTGVNIPTDIFVHIAENAIPSSIKIDASETPEEIDLVYNGKPIPIEIRGLPQTINVEMEKAIPDRIVIDIPKPIPDRIIIEHNIPSQITYIGPISIPVFVPEDIFIPIKFPDKMPEVEMVWRGAPIELKITMDKIMDKDAEGKNCVMIVPCNK